MMDILNDPKIEQLINSATENNQNISSVLLQLNHLADINTKYLTQIEEIESMNRYRDNCIRNRNHCVQIFGTVSLLSILIYLIFCVSGYPIQWAMPIILLGMASLGINFSIVKDIIKNISQNPME